VLFSAGGADRLEAETMGNRRLFLSGSIHPPLGKQNLANLLKSPGDSPGLFRLSESSLT